MNLKNQEYICNLENSKTRIDVFISKMIGCSRNQAIHIIENHSVFINNKIIKKKNTLINENDILKIIYKDIAPIIPYQLNINDIKIIFIDENFVFINKPPFLSVHPANTNDNSYTLLNFCKNNSFWDDSFNDPKNYRYGIVHRLDKETSGVICIARHLNAYSSLKNLFEKRLVQKEYIAFVNGKLKNKEGIINKRIIRDPLNPTRMTYSINQGRIAETHYKVIKEYDSFSMIYCFPKTGRTHQIRVHLASIGNSIIGDKIYGKESNLINRQALHAKKINFIYNEKEYAIEVDLNSDMHSLIR